MTGGEVVTPIAISSSTALSFAKFAARTGGCITVEPTGAVSAAGAVVSLAGSATTAATFAVTGDTNSTYSIGYADNNLTHTDTVTTMALALNSTVGTAGTSGGTTVATGTLSSGSQNIYVGGTLTVGSLQTPGVYYGTVTVTVEYN
ncbi:DUF4402 domain-containing protein [Massilia glaciei]|uniref:DUF4402 domain-containing protein n=1 Tax=Massilia glaciei TaxID=1524097 RepID=UPI0015E81464|nr:DUF4402 domain-containing protein [Massilia glaciei]